MKSSKKPRTRERMRWVDVRSKTNRSQQTPPFTAGTSGGPEQPVCEDAVHKTFTEFNLAKL